MRLEILVAILATDFQDLVAKVKNLVALAPVLGAILRPDLIFQVLVNQRFIINFEANHNALKRRCHLVRPSDNTQTVKKKKVNCENMKLDCGNIKLSCEIIKLNCEPPLGHRGFKFSYLLKSPRNVQKTLISQAIILKFKALLLSKTRSRYYFKKNGGLDLNLALKCENHNFLVNFANKS